jgi:hypothetical protein
LRSIPTPGTSVQASRAIATSHSGMLRLRSQASGRFAITAARAKPATSAIACLSKYSVGWPSRSAAGTTLALITSARPMPHSPKVSTRR